MWCVKKTSDSALFLLFASVVPVGTDGHEHVGTFNQVVQARVPHIHVQHVASGRVVVPNLVLETVVEQQRFSNLPSPHLAANLDPTLLRYLRASHTCNGAAEFTNEDVAFGGSGFTINLSELLCNTSTRYAGALCTVKCRGVRSALTM